MVFEGQKNFGNSCGVYRIRNTVNGKCYIGQTKEAFNKRYWLHNHLLSHGKHDNRNLQQDYDKFGTDAFVFETLELRTNDDTDEINAGEVAWINYYKNRDLAYNILDGGPGAPGVHLSDHAKKIIGEKNRQHMLGKKHSEATKRKMSEQRKGHKPWDSIVVNDPEDARKIKELLIKGVKPPEVAEQLGVPYKLVNKILSNNIWSTVHVEGWDEFQATREKKYKRITLDEYNQLMADYAAGMTTAELVMKYNKGRHQIRNLVTGRCIPKF